jgi:hypothetical protein
VQLGSHIYMLQLESSHPIRVDSDEALVALVFEDDRD